MTIGDITGIICAAIAVATFLMKLRREHPKVFAKHARLVIEAIAEGIPFGFIQNYLAIAILLFTAVRIYDLHKDASDAEKPIDSFWAMAKICIMSGIFAATVAVIRLH